MSDDCPKCRDEAALPEYQGPVSIVEEVSTTALVGKDWIRVGLDLYRVEGADEQTSTVILHVRKVSGDNLGKLEQGIVLSKNLVKALAHHYGEPDTAFGGSR